MNSTGYIRIHSDEWEDAGQLYKVIEYRRYNSESTGVELTLEFNNKQTKRVVPYHWIEWISDDDW